MQQKKYLNKSSDLRQSRKYALYMESIGWKVENGIFIKKIPFLPICFAKYQRPSWPIDKKRFLKTLKDNRVILVSIEPNTCEDEKINKELIKHGYNKRLPMLPSKTIWIDLKKSEKELLEAMRVKTRYNIKKHRRAVQVVGGDKIDNCELIKFYKLYKSNCKSKKIWGLTQEEMVNLVQSFSKKCYLLSTDEAGLMLLVHDKVAYYSHNASSKQGRKQFVPTTLTWEAIKLAKKLGCYRFDFEGIRDERYPITKKWDGFTRFKKGFGGEMVEYIGLFNKWTFL